MDGGGEQRDAVDVFLAGLLLCMHRCLSRRILRPFGCHILSGHQGMPVPGPGHATGQTLRSLQSTSHPRPWPRLPMALRRPATKDRASSPILPFDTILNVPSHLQTRSHLLMLRKSYIAVDHGIVSPGHWGTTLNSC